MGEGDGEEGTVKGTEVGRKEDENERVLDSREREREGEGEGESIEGESIEGESIEGEGRKRREHRGRGKKEDR